MYRRPWSRFFWLGRGYPLNPYLGGLINDLLRKEMRPREFSLIPDELFQVKAPGVETDRIPRRVGLEKYVRNPCFAPPRIY
jgi:hypothetical protein